MNYKDLQKLAIDTEALSLMRGDGRSDYFCTPRGATVIGRAGVDGIHFCTVKKFGEMIFDLTDANIPDCAVIDATCSFGELSIRLPDYARAEVTHGGEAFCAEVTCNHPQPRDTSAPVVYINAECSLGDISIH